jgi:hypothetical protein
MEDVIDHEMTEVVASCLVGICHFGEIAGFTRTCQDQ